MADPIFTAHDGHVFYRGTYRTPEECERLLAIFRDAGAQPDWWAKEARRLAAELADAMRAAGITQREAA